MNYDPDSVKSIFYQRSKVVQEEFALIELMIEREGVLKRLIEAIKDVNDLRKELDDAQILKTFRLFNMMREVTIRFIKTVENWQGSFTRFIRPELYSIDYMASKFLRDIDFINSSKVKKLFNFQFYRGNVLLLPYQSGVTKNIDPLRVHPELGEEIRKFSHPDEEVVVACYQVLINCLPEDIYLKKLVSLEKWLIDPWTPNVFVYSKTDQPLFTPELIATLLGGSTATAEPIVEDSVKGGRPRSAKKGIDQSKSNQFSSDKKLPASKDKAVSKLKGTNATSSSKKNKVSSGNNLPDINGKIKSNLETESGKISLADSIGQDVKTETNSTSSSTVGSYSYKRREKEKPPSEPPLTVEEKRELRKLENYLKDVTSLLKPKAPNTSPTKERLASSDPGGKSDEEIFRSKRIFFSHIPKESPLDELELKKKGDKPSSNALALSSKKSKDVDENEENLQNAKKSNKKKKSPSVESPEEQGNDHANEDDENEEDGDEDEDDEDDEESNITESQNGTVDDSTIASDQTHSITADKVAEPINSKIPNKGLGIAETSNKVNIENPSVPKNQKSTLPPLVPPKPSDVTNVDIGSLMNIKPGDEESTSTYSRKKKKRQHLGVTTAAMRAMFMQQKELERQAEARKAKPLRLIL